MLTAARTDNPVPSSLNKRGLISLPSQQTWRYLAADIGTEAEWCSAWNLWFAWPSHDCEVAAAAPARSRRMGVSPSSTWSSLLDCLSTTRLPPEGSTYISLAKNGSHGPPNPKEGGKFHLAFQPLLRRKPEKKEIESVSWVSSQQYLAPRGRKTVVINISGC